MDRQQTGDREVSNVERIVKSIADLGGADGMMGMSGPDREDRLIEMMANGAREDTLHMLHTAKHVFELEEITDRLRSLLQTWELSALRAGEGAARISYERARQQIEEGYGAGHDDRQNGDGDLLRAAESYLAAGYKRSDTRKDGPIQLASWPWESSHWNPSHDRVRNLEIAGALIAAEIDRILRARKQKGEKPEQPDFDARNPIEVNVHQERPFA